MGKPKLMCVVTIGIKLVKLSFFVLGSQSLGDLSDVVLDKAHDLVVVLGGGVADSTTLDDFL